MSIKRGKLHLSGMMVIDLSNNSLLMRKAFIPTGGAANKIAFRGNTVYVASGYSGLWIVDISDLVKPRSLANVNTGSYTSDVLVSESLLYFVNWAGVNATDTSSGLWIVNISDSIHPNILSHYRGITHSSGSDIPNSIAKSGHLLFMTQVPAVGDPRVLEVIDVNDPSNPHEVGILASSHQPYDVAVKDSFAYYGTYDGGLRIVDVHTPSSPLEVGNVPGVDFAVRIQDTLAYTSSSNLSIIDVTNPNSASIISSIFTHSGSSYVVLAIDSNWAYWAEGILGVVNISDPRNPQTAGSFQGLDRGTGVAARNNIVAFSDNSQGVWVLRNNLITVPQSYTLTEGWNMISAPGILPNRAKYVLFPTAVSSAFAFNSGYEIVDTLQPGCGYWMKFDSSQSWVVTGLPVYSETIAVTKGWNIIGSISVPVPISNISSIPGGMTTSSFFGYDGSYHIYDTIKSGHGYWVRASQAGSLVFSGNPFPGADSKNKIVISPISETPPPPPSGEKFDVNLPREYALAPAFPNPFNSSTTIKYQLPTDSKVTLRVYSALGQIVATLVDRTEGAGFKQIEWNASNLASGVYYYRLEASGLVNPRGVFLQTDKIVLLK